MTEQDEIVTAFGYVVRMQRLLRDAQDSLEYVYREEPEGLSGDEELAAALERLLACLDKWTLPLQESYHLGQGCYKLLILQHGPLWRLLHPLRDKVLQHSLSPA